MTDSYFAGVLEADWAAGRLDRLRRPVAYPAPRHRPGGGGGLLVIGVPSWGLAAAATVRATSVRREDLRAPAPLGGHSVTMGDVLYTTETDIASTGRVGVRRFAHSDQVGRMGQPRIDPSPGGHRRGRPSLHRQRGFSTIPGDRKHSLERMDSSLVRLGSRWPAVGTLAACRPPVQLRPPGLEPRALPAALLGIASRPNTTPGIARRPLLARHPAQRCPRTPGARQ